MSLQVFIEVSVTHWKDKCSKVGYHFAPIQWFLYIYCGIAIPFAPRNTPKLSPLFLRTSQVVARSTISLYPNYAQNTIWSLHSYVMTWGFFMLILTLVCWYAFTSCTKSSIIHYFSRSTKPHKILVHLYITTWWLFLFTLNKKIYMVITWLDQVAIWASLILFILWLNWCLI